MTAPPTPRLLPYAYSIEIAPDGARHVKLLLAEPPTEDALQEMVAFVGRSGSVTWELTSGDRISEPQRISPTPSSDGAAREDRVSEH